MEAERDADKNWQEPDWSREAPRQWWDPGRQLLSSIRRYQHWKERGGPFAPFFRRWEVLRHRFWSVVSGADIPLNCQIGGGLILPHTHGIVIHPDAEIGPNCVIFQQVTIVRRVVVEAGAELGAGSKILIHVRVGERAKVGANAVVTEDVPPRSVVVGIPAKVVKTLDPKVVG